jgi:hypothetical protein
VTICIVQKTNKPFLIGERASVCLKNVGAGNTVIAEIDEKGRLSIWEVEPIATEAVDSSQ